MNPILGEIRIFTFDYAPLGWALCDGATLEIASYPQLFAAIDTTFGGNGETSFGLPDYSAPPDSVYCIYLG